MKRLIENQVVALSVGETAIDCRVAGLDGAEAQLLPLRPAEARLLPPASAGATIVFTHRGGLVMLRGAMYRAADGFRFGQATRDTAAVAEQRRRAGRVEIALPASVTALGPDGTPVGDEQRLVTRDISIGGLALATGRLPLSSGSRLSFTVTLPDLTQVGGTGRVVRAASDMCGVQFEDIAPADRLKLAGFLVAEQRRPGAAPPPR